MRLCLIPAGLILFLQAYPQSGENKKSRANYSRNKIKNQVSWDYPFEGKNPSKNGLKTSVTLFSMSGEIMQVMAFNPKGQVISTERYNYDAQGNKSEYSRFQGSITSRAAYQKISKYNDANLLTEESGYDGVESFLTTYSYNDKGEMTEIRYMKNNALSEKRIFIRKDNKAVVSIYNASGALTSKLYLQYDSHKNLVEEAIYGVNQSELEKKTYNYDENKNLKEEAKYKLDKFTLRTTYNYNASGDLLDISEERPGTEKFLKKCLTYDAGNNLLEIKWRRKNNEDYNQITYTYDEKGICTSAITWYPATKYRVMTRYTYEYY